MPNLTAIAATIGAAVPFANVRAVECSAHGTGRIPPQTVSAMIRKFQTGNNSRCISVEKSKTSPQTFGCPFLMEQASVGKLAKSVGQFENQEEKPMKIMPATTQIHSKVQTSLLENRGSYSSAKKPLFEKRETSSKSPSIENSSRQKTPETKRQEETVLPSATLEDEKVEGVGKGTTQQQPLSELAEDLTMAKSERATVIFNNLHYPDCALPTSFVDVELLSDGYEFSAYKGRIHNAPVYFRLYHKFLRACDAHDLPVGVAYGSYAFVKGNKLTVVFCHVTEPVTPDQWSVDFDWPVELAVQYDVIKGLMGKFLEVRDGDGRPLSIWCQSSEQQDKVHGIEVAATETRKYFASY